MTKIFKTVIRVEVLSEGPYDYECLETLAYDVMFGDCSGKIDVGESKELTDDEARQACREHGTDPEFFWPAAESD